MIFFFVSIFYLILLNLKPHFFKKGTIFGIVLFISIALFFSYFIVDSRLFLKGPLLCPLLFLINYKISYLLFIRWVKRSPLDSIDVAFVFDADEYSKKVKDAIFHIYNNFVNLLKYFIDYQRKINK